MKSITKLFWYWYIQIVHKAPFWLMQYLKQSSTWERIRRDKSLKYSQNWLFNSWQIHIESQMGYKCWEAIRHQGKSIVRMGKSVQIKLEWAVWNLQIFTQIRTSLNLEKFHWIFLEICLSTFSSLFQSRNKK